MYATIVFAQNNYHKSKCKQERGKLEGKEEEEKVMFYL